MTKAVASVNGNKYHKNFKDISGKRFGSWTVLKRAPNAGRTRFHCLCDCGNKSIVFSTNLTRGLSSSCKGCSVKNKEAYHGKSQSSTYSIYIQMKERCHNKYHKYFPYYGARGIEVCEHWREGFKNFLSDMGERPKDLSIDRIENDKGYSKENCRWATKKEQQRNRRNSINIGEDSNGWVVTARLPGKKYCLNCSSCNKERETWSCNFRKLSKCKCTKRY